MTNRELLNALLDAIIKHPEIADKPAFAATYLYSAEQRQPIPHIADIKKIGHTGSGAHAIIFDRLHAAFNTEFID